MKAFMLGIACLCVGAQSALAGDGLTNVQWCLTQTGAPSQSLAMAANDPDGKPRGTRSAAVLVAEAKNAAKAGQDDRAMAWARLCQWHNSGAQATIDADRAAVLAWLKS